MQLFKHGLNPNAQRKHAMALCLQLLQHSQLANYIHIYFIVFLCFIIYQKNLISFSIDCINVSGKALSTKGYFRQEKRLPKVSPRSKSPFIINYGFLIQIGKLFKKLLDFHGPRRVLRGSAWFTQILFITWLYLTCDSIESCKQDVSFEHRLIVPTLPFLYSSF